MCHSNKHPINASCLSLKHIQFPKLFSNSKETISIDGILMTATGGDTLEKER